MNAFTDRITLMTNYLMAKRVPRMASRHVLEHHQQHQLSRFTRNVLSRSDFYRPMAHRSLDTLPIMTKPLMLAEFDRINTRQIKKADAFAIAEAAEQSRDFSAMIGDVSIGLSTGTSGQRGLFLASRRERMQWAGIMLGRMLHGSLFAKHTIAFMLRANNQLYESVSGRARIRFQFFDLAKPVDALVPELEAFAPTILIAPARVLRELAWRRMANIDARRHTPKRLISVAETLFDDDRTIINAAFKTDVEQIYQATEGFLAYTCPHKRLHLNEAFLHVEFDWIDRATGQYSPVITDFSRQTQPIVRYRLDDVLIHDPEPCPCGSPEHVVKRVEGRADDILKLKTIADGHTRALLPDFVARAVAGATDPQTGIYVINDFRVIQTGKAALTIQLDAAQGASPQAAVSTAIDRLCQIHGLQTPDITFAPMTPEDFLHKRRRIKCRIP